MIETPILFVIAVRQTLLVSRAVRVSRRLHGASGFSNFSLKGRKRFTSHHSGRSCSIQLK
jgi:hypothetical protein